MIFGTQTFFVDARYHCNPYYMEIEVLLEVDLFSARLILYIILLCGVPQLWVSC